MVKYLTVGQVKNICSKHEYILVKCIDNVPVGINCKVSKIALKKRDYKDHEKTSIISYMPCNFHEYISQKGKFI